MRNVNVNSIGEYIREQREQAKISVRQLAQSAGVSNPYLSQIERGLRKPSADILQQIAKGLRISAEALYVQAGILDDRPADSGVRSALLADTDITERQKQVLIEIYESFRRENAADAGIDDETDDLDTGEPGAEAEVMEAVLLAEAEADAQAEAQAQAEADARAEAEAKTDKQAWAKVVDSPEDEARTSPPAAHSTGPARGAAAGESGAFSETMPPAGPDGASD
jgi:transcriptional regulator with XRE-family HTH domain